MSVSETVVIPKYIYEGLKKFVFDHEREIIDGENGLGMLFPFWGYAKEEHEQAIQTAISRCAVWIDSGNVTFLPPPSSFQSLSMEED